MTKNEFISELKSALSSRKIENIDEIVADYREHFDHALAQGKSEHEICQKLGSTSLIAQAYETDSMVIKMKESSDPVTLKSALSVLIRLVVIAPFNFLMVCIPGSVIFAFLIAAWCLVVATFTIGMAIVTAAFQTPLASVAAWMPAAMFSTCLFAFSLTVFLAIGMAYITKSFILFIINYLQWNLKFILQK